LSKQEYTKDGQSAAVVTKEALEIARKGRLEEAITAFATAIKLDPSRFKTYRFRGIAYARLGLHVLAIKDFDVAIQHDPDCAGCYYERGTARMLSGQFEDALKDFSNCLHLDREHAPAYSSRAGVFIRKGLYREALEDIGAALLLKPQNSGYLHNRAVILTALGRYGEAIRDYMRVIELSPRSAGSYNNLAWILTTAKDPAYRDCRKAITYAGKALEIGSNGAWMDTLATAHAECGEFEKAVSIETLAYKLSSPPNKNFSKRLEIYKSGKTYAEWRDSHIACAKHAPGQALK